MAEYTKDKRFSGGWVIGGTVLMFVTNFLGGFIATGTGVNSIWVLAAIGFACFAVGGFVIGWKSEGSTILEAGLAALISIAITLGTRGIALALLLDWRILVADLGLPAIAAVLGAYVGEKVQGDVIVTSDD